MKLYQICQPIEPLMERGTGKVISDDSRVVILEFLPKNKVKVCRYGYYLDTITVDLKQIKCS